MFRRRHRDPAASPRRRSRIADSLLDGVLMVTLGVLSLVLGRSHSHRQMSTGPVTPTSLYTAPTGKAEPRSRGLRAFLYRWRWRIAAYVLGGASAFAVMGLGALAVVEFGLFDTTATKPHYALVSWGAHATFTHHTRHAAEAAPAPPSFTSAQVQAGAQEYVSDCMMCHGGPGVARARWVRGLTPTPPYLLDAAQRWTKPQLFWILQRGVKMSAMPAWGETRTDAQLWDLVAFLDALPKLSAADFHKMQPAATASGVAEGVSPSGGKPHFVSPQ